MKIFPGLRNRFHRLNLPGALLLLLLQRSPVASWLPAAEEIVISSPLGAVLKSAVAAVAALGAVNTLVGATPLVPSAGSATGITVNMGSMVSVFYTVNGTQTPPESWTITGNIPPGLNFSGLTSPGTVSISSLHLSGTPTMAGTFNLTLQTFEFTDGGGVGSPIYNYTITVNGAANVAPSFTTQPSSQTVTAGASVTFTAAANGTPAPTYQWRKNGNNINGATNSTFTINPVSVGDAGNYTVVASNSAGNVTSNTATLTVNPANSAPSFTTQPASQNVVAGVSVTFTAAANGTPTPTYQWRKNGVNINGATGSSYTIVNVTGGDSGSYTVVASNSVSSVTSSPAMLVVTTPLNDFNGDGQTDIVWENITTGEHGIWLMNAFNVVNWAGLPSVPTDWHIVGTGDFNGDGQTDIVWENSATGERGIWLMSGSNVVNWAGLPTIPTDWHIVGTGDFNDDGQTDIVWENSVTGEHGIWLMSGSNVVNWASLPSVPTDWHVAQ
jgi:Immunoglobulin domain